MPRVKLRGTHHVEAGACSSSRVAVLMSGWLNVSVPDRGASTRHFLIDPLKADVFLAATALKADCPETPGVNQSTQLGHCLWERISGLEPITAKAMYPMLSKQELMKRVQATPHFHTIRANFSWKNTKWKLGLNIFSPVLGAGHCLREVLDYHRVFHLMLAHERSCSHRYTRVVFTRLESAWIAPHPPLSILDSGVLWTTAAWSRVGVSDRHAVMARDHAPIYFGRWKLLQSPELLQIAPLEYVVKDIPEEFLARVLQWHKIPLGEMPALFFLACCSSAKTCWMGDACTRVPLLPRETICDPSQLAPSTEPAWESTSWRTSTAVSQMRASRGGAPKSLRCLEVKGKYYWELDEARRLFQLVQCPDAFWQAHSRQLPKEHVGPEWEQVYRHTLDVVVPTEEGRYVSAAKLSAHLIVHQVPAEADSAVQLLGRARAKASKVLDDAKPPVLVNAQRYLTPLPGACILESSSTPPIEARPLRGKCAQENGTFGVLWPDKKQCRLPKLDILTLPQCAFACSMCDACVFVSYSKAAKRCFWFQTCDTFLTTTAGEVPIQFWDAETVHARRYVGQFDILTQMQRWQGTLGFCEVTTDGDHGDCEKGDKGMWHLGRNSRYGVTDVPSCIAQCHKCARCRYVSVSASMHDCSWYHSCDILNLKVMSTSDHVTYVAAPPHSLSALNIFN